MPEAQRGAAKSTAWGVVAGISGSGAFATWIAATSDTAFPAWPAWTLGILTLAASYLCFKPVYGTRPFRRRPRAPGPATTQSLSRHPDDVELLPERDGMRLRLLLRNNSEPTEFSVQVIAVRDPLGRAIGPQHWTVPWLDDSSTEPKRVLCGQTRILDFARYDAIATENEIRDGQGDTAHWQFSSVPHTVKARYYNLRCQADLDEQRFLLTVRLISARLGAFADRELAVGVQAHEPVCEAADERDS
jgi:hypothetical protein